MKIVSKILKIGVTIICIAIAAFSVDEFIAVHDRYKQCLNPEKYREYYFELPEEDNGIVNVKYKDGFYLESYVVENEAIKVNVTENDEHFNYSLGLDKVCAENFEVSLSENEKNQTYTDGTLYKTVKGLEGQQISATTDSEDSSKNICENEASIVDSYTVEVFDHKIADNWGAGLKVNNDSLELSNGDEHIYIYYLSDEPVIYDQNDVLNTSAIISKTGKTSDGYNVYLMFDQTVLFEVLAPSDEALEEAFYVREVRG